MSELEIWRGLVVLLLSLTVGLVGLVYKDITHRIGKIETKVTGLVWVMFELIIELHPEHASMIVERISKYGIVLK